MSLSAARHVTCNTARGRIEADVRSPRREVLGQQLEERPRRLDLASDGAVGARLRVPGVDVEMRPSLRLVDEPPKEERGGDRARHAAARARIADIGDLPSIIAS